MQLGSAVAAYLSGLRLQGGAEHLEQARIVLTRAVEWLGQPHPELKVPFKPVHELTDLSTQALTEFLAFRKDSPGVKPQSKLSLFTLAKEARYLRCFLNSLASDPHTFGLPPGWLMPTIPKIRTPKKAPQALEAPDLDLTFEACQYATLPIVEGITAAQWWFTLLYLAYLTAMRRRALFAVPRPTEAHLDRQVLYLPAEANKNQRDQFFPLTPLACDLIRAMPARPGEPMFVWVGRCGSRNFRTFYHEYGQIQRKAGILASDQSRLHSLRRTSLTYMARAGVGLSTVQQHAGHSDPKVTADFYLGSMTVPQTEAVKNLPTPKAMKSATKQRTLFD